VSSSDFQKGALDLLGAYPFAREFLDLLMKYLADSSDYLKRFDSFVRFFQGYHAMNHHRPKNNSVAT
jgi:hypothetical protein